NALIDARRCDHTAKQVTSETALSQLTSSDSAGLRFYGIPSLACPSSPIQFARLAPELEPKREFLAAGNPGFAVPESLADHPSTYADFHTDIVRKHIA